MTTRDPYLAELLENARREGYDRAKRERGGDAGGVIGWIITIVCFVLVLLMCAIVLGFPLPFLGTPQTSVQPIATTAPAVEPSARPAARTNPAPATAPQVAPQPAQEAPAPIVEAPVPPPPALPTADLSNQQALDQMANNVDQAAGGFAGAMPTPYQAGAVLPTVEVKPVPPADPNNPAAMETMRQALINSGVNVDATATTMAHIACASDPENPCEVTP